MPENQAKIQADTLAALVAMQDEKTRQELATKQDLAPAIKGLEVRLVKWQFGLAAALAAIMAKGFWLVGFLSPHRQSVHYSNPPCCYFSSGFNNANSSLWLLPTGTGTAISIIH